MTPCFKFRFSDGSTATSTFEATQKLSEARSHIVANDLVHGYDSSALFVDICELRTRKILNPG